jgi:hypothetical protein
MKRDNPAEAQQRLIEFARQICKAGRDGRTGISRDLSTWFTRAVAEHLIAESDLDQALGLARKNRGRPPEDAEQKRELALRVHELLPPKPKPGEKKRRVGWCQIARDVGFNDGTENDLRKLYQDYFDQDAFTARVIDREVAESIKQENERRERDRLAALQKARAKISRP